MTEEKKGRGSSNFMTRLKETQEEVAELKALLYEIREILDRLPELDSFLNHPVIRDWQHVENRIRKTEQIQRQMMEGQHTIDNAVRRAERAAALLTGEVARRRGA